MTVQTDVSRADYTGNGVTVAFPVPFRFLENSHLRVIRTVIATGVEAVLTLDGLGSTGYTVSGANQPNGGTVTTNAAPANLTEKLTILLNVPITQLIDYIANDPFPAESHERGLDKLTMIAKAISEVLTRCLKLPESLIGTSASFPSPDPLKAIRWNSVGSGLENYEPSSLSNPGGSDLVGFIQSGASAILRTVQAKLREVELSVTDYADNPASLITGSEACDNAWSRAQAALFAISPEGGTIKFPRGSYRFTATMQVGNNTTGVPSTLNGVRIKGDGWGRTATTMNANGAATRLYWDGAVGGTLMHIKGPISGICVEDLMLDGNGKAATLLHTQRSFHQSVKRVLGVNWANGYALVIDANNANAGYGGAAPISHVYEQFDLQNPGAGANGWDIANGAGNVNQILFNRCYNDRDNTTSAVGMQIGYCDHIQVIGCHIAQTGASGSTGIAIKVKPQTGQGAFPWNITFTGTAMAGGVAYDSSLQAWTNATYPALIFQPFYTADGAPVPPASANGGAALPAFMARGVTDNGIEFGWTGEDQESVAATPTIAPKKRVILLADDDAVAANNLIATITPPRSVTSVPLGGYRITIIPVITGTNPVKLVTGGNIAQQVVLTNLQAVELVYSEGTGFWSIIDPCTDGRYTPTLTNTTNVSASTARECMWTRVGNTVTVAGRVEVTPTAAADTLTVIELTLPVLPVAFGNSWEAAGTATIAFTPYRPGLIIGQSQAARIQFHSNGTASVGAVFNFSYQLT